LRPWAPLEVISLILLESPSGSPVTISPSTTVRPLSVTKSTLVSCHWKYLWLMMSVVQLCWVRRFIGLFALARSSRASNCSCCLKVQDISIYLFLSISGSWEVNILRDSLADLTSS